MQVNTGGKIGVKDKRNPSVHSQILYTKQFPPEKVN